MDIDKQVICSIHKEGAKDEALIIGDFINGNIVFYDGNKRTARLVANLILLNNNIGVISIPARYKVEYNKLMLDFYETLEADKVIEFLTEKCITFFDKFDYKNYSEIQNKKDFLKQIKKIFFIFFNNFVTTSHYNKIKLIINRGSYDE